MFTLDADDIAIIKAAIQEGGKIWENTKLAPVKRKVKDLIRAVTGDLCCYCQRDLHDEFNLVIDIEHVLPQQKYRDYMFTPLNLNISCKRCNMEIKNDDVSFLVAEATTDALANDSSNYLLIHPNLDVYADHLERCAEQVGTTRIVKYLVLNQSAKGAYTFDYFELQQLEKNSLDEAQGVAANRPTISQLMDPQSAAELRGLLANIGAAAAPDTTAPFI